MSVFSVAQNDSMAALSYVLWPTSIDKVDGIIAYCTRDYQQFEGVLIMKWSQMRLLIRLVCFFSLIAGHAGATTWYVATNGNDSAAGTNWNTAKLTIQGGISVAQTSAVVWVSNGVYATGVHTVSPYAVSNRIVVTNGITVRSVGGPNSTMIVGAWDPVATNGSGAVRCAYVGANASLIGFTLTNGATLATSSYSEDQLGGGVYCAANAVVSNCMLSGNASATDGGGTFQGMFFDCMFSGNIAGNAGGGAYLATLTRCTLASNVAVGSGGGSAFGTLSNCTVTGNSSGGGGGSANDVLYYCVLSGNKVTGGDFTYGGGAANSVLDHCVVTGNSVPYGGGGAEGGSSRNCLIMGNSAQYGGGSFNVTLYNCTVASNSASSYGGGSCNDTLYNSIVYFNAAADYQNSYNSTFNYSCTTPDPGGVGNITDDPRFVDAASTNFHLITASPCKDAGSNVYVSGATDLGGTLRIVNGTVDMGAYEWLPTVTVLVPGGNATGSGTYPPGSNIVVSAVAFGHWFFSDWNDGNTNASRTIVVPSSDITYTAILTQYVGALTFFVTTNGSDVADGHSWVTSKLTIQSGVGEAADGDTVIVSNGIYTTGAQVYGASATSNRVAVTNAIKVQSASGPGVTTIAGTWVPVSTNGASAMRCVYLGPNAILSGFTLSNGATRTDEYDYRMSGGGAWCEVGATLTNCILTHNAASGNAGGCYQGTLYGCTLSGNAAGEYGGGAYNSTLSSCTLSNNTADTGGGCFGGTITDCVLANNQANYGGGIAYGTLLRCLLQKNLVSSWGGGGYSATLQYCTVTGNQAGGGGGAQGSTLFNCLLVGNSSTSSGGGGSWNCDLYNCTVVSNSAAGYGGGSYADNSLQNCIVYFNTGVGIYPNCFNPSAISALCTPDPIYTESGLMTADPRFMALGAGNFRLATNSPCINAGNNAYTSGATDLDGNPRIIGGMVDIGVYESTNGATVNGVPWGWLLQYGLATDGSADTIDPASNGLPVWERYIACVDPTNPAASFRVLQLSNNLSHCVVFTPNTPSRVYTLEYTTNLVTGSWTNVPGQFRVPGTGEGQSLGDTNSFGSRCFYRVKVALP